MGMEFFRAQIALSLGDRLQQDFIAAYTVTGNRFSGKQDEQTAKSRL
jgi:hypothetical protein